MYWAIYSIIAAISTAAYSLLMKRGVATTFALDFSSWYSVVGAVLLGIYNLITKVPFTMSPWGIVAGVFQAISMNFVASSVKVAPNPGLMMAVFYTQSIATTIAAHFLFGSHIHFSTIVAIAVVISGVYLTSKSKESFTNKLPQPSQKPTSSSKWIYLILLAGITATVIDIATKKMYLSSNPNSATFLFYLFVAQSICFLAYDKYQTGTFRLEDQNEDGRIDRKDIGITVIMGIAFLTAICGLTAGVKKSPNVGYVKAIMMSSALMSTIAAKFIFGSPITVKSVCGMVLILGGVLYIAFTNN